MATGITPETARFCFLDLDFDNYRHKLATAAAFVDATDARYGFSSKDLRALGGSELSRIEDLIASDHEFSAKLADDGGVEIRPPAAGNRIVLKLFWDIAPLACENFATLCANGSMSSGASGSTKKLKPAPVGESGKPLTYRNSTVHRVIPKFIMQGGDFVFGNGAGGESIFGKKFKDERAGLGLKHDRKGILSMGNSGKNSNTSQFFITFTTAPQCDGKHVIFGEVVSGWEVLEYAEQFGTAGGEPTVPITITDCGLWVPLRSPGCGYWYDQPDAEQYSGISPVFMVRPRVAVVGPNSAVVEKFTKSMGSLCSVSAAIICADEMEDEEAQKDRVCKLLDGFMVDVILVAPACKGIVGKVQTPRSWVDTRGELVPASEVILESKPVEALRVIRQESWLAKHTSWHFDCASTA